MKEKSPFHTKPIEKGEYGELSKIQEELDEAFDAQKQKNDLMLLIELADIVGAVEGVAEKFGFTIEQLLTFARKRSEVAIFEENQKKGESNYEQV
jgi:predicted house-cleaning noncanonical NTP pyrophosphatase (MazG superfamily)